MGNVFGGSFIELFRSSLAALPPIFRRGVRLQALRMNFIDKMITQETHCPVECTKTRSYVFAFSAAILTFCPQIQILCALSSQKQDSEVWSRPGQNMRQSMLRLEQSPYNGQCQAM